MQQNKPSPKGGNKQLFATTISELIQKSPSIISDTPSRVEHSTNISQEDSYNTYSHHKPSNSVKGKLLSQNMFEMNGSPVVPNFTPTVITPVHIISEEGFISRPSDESLHFEENKLEVNQKGKVGVYSTLTDFLGDVH